MKNPYFSVIIPTFNRSDLVIRTVKSVINSTFTDFEIVVVDDGSTDDTKEKILRLSDNRVSYFFINNSGGPARPRNIGIEKTNGKWLCFLDSDDLFDPNKLQRLHHYITTYPDVEIFYHKLRCTHSRYSAGHEFNFVSKKALYRLLVENPIALSGVCISKSFMITSSIVFNEEKEFGAVEDWDCWITAHTYGCQFKFIDEELGQYDDLGSDCMSKSSDMVSKERMVANKYCHKLRRFERIFVSEYWMFRLTKSRLQGHIKLLPINGTIVEWFSWLVINTLALAIHPSSIVCILGLRFDNLRSKRFRSEHENATI